MSWDIQMRNVFVVCEGQTEETFISTVVAPAFYPLGINLIAQLIETSPGHKGGALSYERVERHLRNTLRNKNQPVVTTLIDLYKLNKNFPGFHEAAGKPLEQRLQILHEALHTAIVQTTSCSSERFIPYIQPYEFEALLFSDVATLTSIESTWSNSTAVLQGFRGAVATPEHINDSSTTKPSSLLERHLKDPSYRKTLHGPLATQYIGLTVMEEQCKFFAAWLASLRELAPS